ncbi:ParB/RepB/Spo0J family partition protein [Flaviflexus salsibiostraticola]|uniref:ParB/RepB/Spo0J family partition protein n=1 Tax=Flaviflexus salsibiostraticola TaxID=1282737 RepID=A0A3S8ZA03_9ACTO|nr:ParB/RepB/Spo0J family partition protein [Flaviflexus salsibiostraticola]AZN30296.1 ParB/RepB/Spo0J family partition protein [Flaviflexus salsibiostraticola]
MAERRKTPARKSLGKGISALFPAPQETDGDLPKRQAIDVFFGDGPLTAVESAPTPEALDQVETPEPYVPTPDEPAGLVPVPGAVLTEIPVDQIFANTKQPRTVFDEDELAELADSIAEVGLLQPIVVRHVPDGGYELIMGERRWRASARAGLESIPAIVRDTADDDLLRDALLENLHRVELNPLEEASAYQQLLEDFGCTQEELSRRIARSRPQISNTLRLLKLPPLVQRRVAAGVLSAGHARALLGLTDPAAMERLAQRIVAEGLSVRAVEEIVALGDEPRVRSAGRATRETAPQLMRLSEDLSNRLDTRVKIRLGARKGTMTVDFGSIEDLNRILDVLSLPVERIPDGV